MGNTTFDFGCKERKCLVTVDTGTSHLAMPGFAIDIVKGTMPLR